MKKLLFVATICALVGLAFVVGQLTSRNAAVYADGPIPQTNLAATNEAPGVSVMKRTEVTIPVVSHPVADRIQWEYKTVQTNSGDLPDGQLDQLGNEGWEMCGVHQRGQLVSTYYFKREKGSGANPGNRPVFAPTIPWREPAKPGPVEGLPRYYPAPLQNEPRVEQPMPIQPVPFRDAPAYQGNAEPANEPAKRPADHTESIMRPQAGQSTVPTEPKVIEAK